MSDKIKAELLVIQKTSKDKMLHAANVVAWAKRNRKSALHREFEWNNTRAAEEFRLWQAYPDQHRNRGRGTATREPFL